MKKELVRQFGWQSKIIKLKKDRQRTPSTKNVLDFLYVLYVRDVFVKKFLNWANGILAREMGNPGTYFISILLIPSGHSLGMLSDKGTTCGHIFCRLAIYFYLNILPFRLLLEICKPITALGTLSLLCEASVNAVSSVQAIYSTMISMCRHILNCSDCSQTLC